MHGLARHRTLRIASWNVNSVRLRIPRLIAFLKRHQPDIVMLQETKVADENFPRFQVEAAGYRVILNGQPGYHGVATLVRDPSRASQLSFFDVDSSRPDHPNVGLPSQVHSSFPGNPVPGEARFLSVQVAGIHFVNLYVVNGQDVKSPQFAVKQAWMAALTDWVRKQAPGKPLLMAGDFNVAPSSRDVWDPVKLENRIHCTVEERTWFNALCSNRLVDLGDDPGRHRNDFTWWPYQEQAFERGEGLRFDLALGSPEILALKPRVWVDVQERRPNSGLKAPSDHAPIFIDLPWPPG